jgi:hypothetical protein
VLKFLTIAFVTSFVAGCGSTPIITPAQEMESLKVYPDNRVGFVIKGSGKRTVYSYHDNPNEILAYRFHTGSQYSYFNAIDIASIISDGNRNMPTVVTMNDGHSYKSNADSFGLFRCNTQKACSLETGGNIRYAEIKTINANVLFDRSISEDSINPYIYDSFPLSEFLPSRHSSTEINPKGGQLYSKLVQQLDERMRHAKYAAGVIFDKKKEKQDREAVLRTERLRFIEQEAKNMRANAKIGTFTNCGQIFDIRLPMVGVQTTMGMQYLQLDLLYGQSVDCRFVNGHYDGITYR